MNQIALVLQQSNERMQKIMKGGYKSDDIQNAQREAEIQIKAVNQVFQAYAVMSKNARAKSALSRMNIIDDTTAVDLLLGDPEVDKVKCPIKDHLITRAECLDYSGTHCNPEDDCVGCVIGEETKSKLLPE